MDATDVSIIILTKNAGDNFKPLLERIFSQKFNGRYEVLVIDSGSLDDTLKIAPEFPVKITQIRPEEFHHGKTRNLGAQLANGSILVYISQDALPLDNDWLQKLVDNLKDPRVAMVCGRQIAWPTTKPPEKFFYVYNFPPQKIVVAPGASNCYHDNIFISNVNSAIKKDIWQQFKFSEAITMAEDKEFAKRILFAGWSIAYEPEASVYHAHDLSLSLAFQRASALGISLTQGARFVRKSRKVAINEVMKYLGKEAAYLSGNGYLKWLPYSVLYDGSKFLGQLSGELRGKLTNRKA